MLRLSDKRIYAYVERGLLSAVGAARIIMILIEEVKKFQPKASGYSWSISSGENLLLTISLFVQVKVYQQKRLQLKLREIKQAEDHIFSGTVARYIIWSKAHPERLEVLLIWRSTTIPGEMVHRQQAFDTLQQELKDLPDWNMTPYDEICLQA